MRASWAFPSCFCLIFQDNTRLKNISFLHHLCEGRTIYSLITFWTHYLVVPSFNVGLSNTINAVTLHDVVKALLLTVSTQALIPYEKVMITSQDEQNNVETGIVSPRGSTISIVLSLIRAMGNESQCLSSSASVMRDFPGSINPTLCTDESRRYYG